MLQAADYSATMNYLNAVKAVGTDDADKVMAHLKKTKINDMFAKNGEIRPDGRMVHDMYLMQVKTAVGIEVPMGLLQGRRHHPGRPGLHDQGRDQVRAVEVRSV